MTKTKQDLRSEATRQLLVTAARTLFGARGYADVGTEEIVRAAGEFARRRCSTPTPLPCSGSSSPQG